MLKRWNIKIYNIDFLIAILDYVLTFIVLDLKLYIKALILKEILKISLRYKNSKIYIKLLGNKTWRYYLKGINSYLYHSSLY